MRIGQRILIMMVMMLPSLCFAEVANTSYIYESEEILKAKIVFDNYLLKTAEKELSDAVESFPELKNSGRLAMQSAKIDFIQGNHVFADRKLEEFIKENPNSPYLAPAALYRAYMAFEAKEYDKAQKLFAAAKISADKEFAKRGDSLYVTMSQDALFWRAVSMSQRGEYDDAQPLFEECYRKYPNGKYSDDALFSLGLIAEMNRQYDNSLTYFRTVSKSHPYSNCLIASKIREVNNNLILRDPSSALMTLENADNLWRKLISKDTAFARYETQSYVEHASEELLYLKGEAYNIQKNYDKALVVFESFLSTFTESHLIDYVRLGAGWALLNKEDYDEAVKYYNIVIQSVNDENSKISAIAELYRAIALKRSGDISGAQREFSALSVQANYPFVAQALLELGQIYYESKDYENARRSLERAERESQDANLTVRIQLLMGSSLMELKKWEKAVSAYKIAEQMALKANPLFMPQKEWFVAEARLKQGIALVRSMRNTEAIPPLLAFIGDNQNDSRIDEAIFWIAEAYYRSDMLKNAAEKYESLVNLYPQSPLREESLYGMGWSYFRMKNFKKSSETFNKMLHEFPDSRYGLEVLVRQGDGYYITRDYNDAASCYKRAAQMAPNTEEGQYAAYQLCHAYYRQGQFESATNSLLSFVRQYAKSSYAPHALYLTGWIRFQQKKYSEAAENFEFLIQAYPNNNLVPRAHYTIGDCFYNQGNFEKAITSYKNLVENYPNDPLAPEAMKSIQDCYLSLGNQEEAIKIADRFVSSNPTSPFASEFVFKKGEMFYTGKLYKDAVAEYDSFIKKYPDSDKNAEAMYWMGKSYINLNDPDRAEQTFRELQRKFPKSDYAPQSMLERALIMKSKGNIKSADSLFNKTQELFPETQSAAQAGFEKAVIKLSLGDTVASLRTFREVAERYKGMDYADQSRYKIAMYFKINGMRDSALKEFDILANTLENPTIAAEAQYRIGEIWMREANYDEASKAFLTVKEKFSDSEDWFPLALLNLGECYEKLGQTASAIEVYNVLSTLRPNDDYGKTATRRLKSLESNK